LRANRIRDRAYRPQDGRRLQGPAQQ
jgi:hypothetical protein